MPNLKSKLTPTKVTSEGSSVATAQLQISPPAVKVNAHIAAPQITIDGKAFADALDASNRLVAQISQQINQLAQTNTAVLTALQHQIKAMENLSINVEAPVVKLPHRPRGFNVVLGKKNGETVSMSIEAKPVH